jgi:hypothetical protein
MSRKRNAGKPHHPYPQGGRRKRDAAPAPPQRPSANRSWDPGDKGQGGEGLSKGYGGSRGSGTGPSGPDRDKHE